MPVKVELFDDLDAVARDAGGALSRAARKSLFERLDWFRLTLAHCPPAGVPLVARAEGDAGRAWLFLMVDRGVARALASWYTLDYRAVVEGAGEAGLLAAIARALARRRPRVARVEMAPILDPAGLRSGFRAGGWFTRVAAATAGWRAHVDGADFADYWERRPGRLRATAQRKAVKAKLDISIIKHFDETAWAAYEQVYAQSWKPAEGSPAFLRELAESEGGAGTLRLGIARREGEPVAAQLWLIENGVATIHKLAHVEVARAHSPGTLLGMAMFRAVIDGDRPEWIDFGTGDDTYKADWMDERRPLYRLEAWNPATLGGLAGTGRAAIASLVRRGRSG